MRQLEWRYKNIEFILKSEYILTNSNTVTKNILK
jgi:hypothetical protein